MAALGALDALSKPHSPPTIYKFPGTPTVSLAFLARNQTTSRSFPLIRNQPELVQTISLSVARLSPQDYLRLRKMKLDRRQTNRRPHIRHSVTNVRYHQWRNCVISEIRSTRTSTQTGEKITEGSLSVVTATTHNGIARARRRYSSPPTECVTDISGQLRSSSRRRRAANRTEGGERFWV